MKVGELLTRWGFTGLKLKTPFLEADWNPTTADQDAAWDLYVELLTRIATQPLEDGHGREVDALASVYSLFPTTRSILKSHGRAAVGFTRIAVVVLNQVVRPFTTKWHRRAEDGALEEVAQRRQFRKELKTLQGELASYCGLLAELAGVEDLTEGLAPST